MVGVLGVTYFFSSDRSSGFYEYILASEDFSIKDIYISYAFSTIVIISMILAINIGITTLALYIIYGDVPSYMLGLIAVYSLPITYISGLLLTLSMLTWTSLSKTYSGLNAPGGIGTIVGIAPPTAFLVINNFIVVNNLYLYSIIYCLFIFIVLVALFSVSIKKMSCERMLA